MTDLLPNQRHLFDIPDGVAYLNCATMGPLPQAATRAGQAGLARKGQPWTISSADFFADTDSLRPKLAQLINAEPDAIAFVPSVSYGLAIAARNLRVEAGQHIVTLADQFPSNVYVWRELASRSGAQLKTVGEDAGNLSLSDAVLSAIGPQTAIVSCAHVRWTDGAWLDLAAIGARCREVGAALVLDLTQSCGALSFDVKRVQPDFMVAAGYKWLLGPYAMGFLYVGEHWQNGVALEHNWITREGARDFTQLTNYTDRHAPGARRFDMGERSNFALLPALEASVDLLLEWGVERVEATLSAANLAVAERLGEIGLACLAPSERGGHYLGARLPEHAPPDLTEQLTAQNIHVSRRGTTLRITPHLYNTPDDTDRLITALKAII